jgi:hypothetical protein
MSNQPFPLARESMKSILDTILLGSRSYSINPPIEIDFAKAISVLFYKGTIDQFFHFAGSYIQDLDNYITHFGSRVKGVYTIVVDIASLFDFGSPKSPLVRAFLAIYRGNGPANGLL